MMENCNCSFNGWIHASFQKAHTTVSIPVFQLRRAHVTIFPIGLNMYIYMLSSVAPTSFSSSRSMYTSCASFCKLLIKSFNQRSSLSGVQRTRFERRCSAHKKYISLHIPTRQHFTLLLLDLSFLKKKKTFRLWTMRSSKIRAHRTHYMGTPLLV